MAKETPIKEEVKTDAEGKAPEFVEKSQYDALLTQAQNIINELNAKIAALEADKKVLQDTLAIQNKLVEKLLNSEQK